MKPSSPPAPLSLVKARNCALMNQFGTPGLGSLMARRFLTGVGQLVVFLTGFAMFVTAFVDEVRQYYKLMYSDAQPQLRYGLVLGGIGLCLFAWLWALVTSLNLMREAKREEQGKMMQSVPPVIR